MNKKRRKDKGNDRYYWLLVREEERINDIRQGKGQRTKEDSDFWKRYRIDM